MPWRVPGLLWLLTLVVAFAAPARPSDSPRLLPPRITRERMEQQLEGSGGFLIVYGTRTPEAAATTIGWARRIGRRLADGDSSLVRPDTLVTAVDLAGRNVVLLGNPRENAWTDRVAPALPVTFRRDGFRWQGTEYATPGDRLRLVWPNPLAPSRFMIVVAGNRLGADRPTRLPWSGLGRRDWEIARDGKLARYGAFARGPRPWHYNPALDHDLEAEGRRFTHALRSCGDGPVRVRATDDTLGRRVLGEAGRLESRLERLGFSGTGEPPLALTLYPSLEAKGERTGDTHPEHLDSAGAAHAALPAGRSSLDLWSLAAARLRSCGAAADSPWLRAAAVWLCGRFEGEPLEVAVHRLAAGGLLPPGRQAASGDAGWRSPLITIPAGAIIVRSLYECAGVRGVRALLAAPDPGSLATACRAAGVSEAAVEDRYARLADSLAQSGAAGVRRRRSWRPADGFQAGVCLAHDLSLEGGYLSAACGVELTRLDRMGARWVSLTPFGFVRPGGSPEIVPTWDSGPAGESDEAVGEAAARARALGLHVWLAPHLWTRGFVGDLTFDSAGWQRFFAGYREFILHYALLAEREGMDGLVVGHELTRAALDHPERWRTLIAEVRRVYHGTLTYGANWGEEVKGVRFWDALDVVGVSLYTPIASTPTRDVATLEAGVRQALAELREVGERSGRPVLLLEAGYAARSGAAVRPWEEWGGVRDLGTQRACYQAMVRALAREGWVAGVLWWKWRSDDDSGGPADASYTPRGKPAERVMSEAFAAWAGRKVRVPASKP